MSIDQPIFGFRSGANESILPTREELKVFLDSPRRAGRMEANRDEFAHYDQILRAVEDFKQSRKQGGVTHDFHEKLYYGVLMHSGFFTPLLKSAVEHFKYYSHALGEIDLKKPAAFIKSAEEEISRLNKKNESVKIERLLGMINERKTYVEAQKSRWPVLRAELGHIAKYVRENLGAVQKLCEASIEALVDLQVGKKAESQLIEDIKTHFKDQIRDYLQHGPVTKEYVESMKETVAMLSKQISVHLLEDIYTMTGLYEVIHDHVKTIKARLDPHLKQIAVRQGTNLEEDKEFFAGVEQELVALLSDLRVSLTSSLSAGKETEHEKILLEKRRDMLDRLFDLLASR